MSGEPAKPIFGFVWARTPEGGADIHTTRWLRVTPRGPWRLAFLILLSLAVASVIPPAIAAFFAAPSPYAAAVIAVVLLPSIALLARGWVAGCSVNDSGIKVASTVRTTYVTWTHVSDIVTIDGRSRWLGTPLRVPGSRLVIATDQVSLDSGLCTASPDLWLRPQAWASAHDRVMNWWRESRSGEASAPPSRDAS